MNEIDDDVYRVIDNNFNDQDDENGRSQSAFNQRQNNYSEIKAPLNLRTNTLIKSCVDPDIRHIIYSIWVLGTILDKNLLNKREYLLEKDCRSEN